MNQAFTRLCHLLILLLVLLFGGIPVYKVSAYYVETTEEGTEDGEHDVNANNLAVDAEHNKPVNVSSKFKERDPVELEQILL